MLTRHLRLRALGLSLMLGLTLTSAAGICRPVTRPAAITVRVVGRAGPAKAHLHSGLNPSLAEQGAGTTAPYVNPAQFFNVPFGSASHWAQPWRAYLETVPASTFLNGVGAVWGGGDIAALAAHGVRRLRIEEGWSNVDFDDPTRLDGGEDFAALLQQCQSNGIRPLILLNANTGVPCPVRFSLATVAAAAPAGATTITLTDTTGLVPGYSGLTNVTGYAAARPLFTAVSGNEVTLAQPCPVCLTAGQQITVSTLKFQPFTAPGGPSYNATASGWNAYVLAVVRAARTALGTAGTQDGGFDLEIWNELTFGSDFLNAANYGLPSGPDMTSTLITLTSWLARTHRADFAGVGMGNGFANTIPWPSASGMPTQITAIDKHPYENRSAYPSDTLPGTSLNAYFQPDSYTPTYTALFPEYYGTFLQTESLLRDASPLADGSFLYSGLHGRNVRPGIPCPVWITEYNMPSDGLTPAQTVKAFLRAYCFYLNKGAGQLDWYNTAALTREQLDGLAALTGVMRNGLDPSAAPRAISLLSVSDTHGHAQFMGDGAAEHPPLRDRDVFAFLPFQVNSHKFVVPYYVMSRDVAQDLPEEAFTLMLSGTSGGVTVTATDAATGQPVPVTVQPMAGGRLQLNVSATDSVRLLTIDDCEQQVPLGLRKTANGTGRRR